MPEVEIEYCVPCGFLDRAENVQHVLLTTFGERLDAVTLRTGANGVFRVTVDGERVYDKQEDAFDVDEIVRRVREHV
ncbi:SelT/SelW/SelH family protein [Halorientalis regularis]|jgi:selenoprotein W-related protein|uniref:Selenoprotein W-related protein n=1 Tax=Halorientalis regularis TaxID=660518 RepID=A0A1G7FPW9_9EURY|nr:Rdx family protein [Halorientalis regularis]SDE77973.1 selenoprotein W-related protein [Halorientalis regularis]